jgi:hypothetical protein
MTRSREVLRARMLAEADCEGAGDDFQLMRGADEMDCEFACLAVELADDPVMSDVLETCDFRTTSRGSSRVVSSTSQ